MPVKLAVSSFPPGEYGYLNGMVKNIAADALESTDQKLLTDNERILFL